MDECEPKSETALNHEVEVIIREWLAVMARVAAELEARLAQRIDERLDQIDARLDRFLGHVQQELIEDELDEAIRAMRHRRGDDTDD